MLALAYLDLDHDSQQPERENRQVSLRWVHGHAVAYNLFLIVCNLQPATYSTILYKFSLQQNLYIF